MTVDVEVLAEYEVFWVLLIMGVSSFTNKVITNTIEMPQFGNYKE